MSTYIDVSRTDIVQLLARKLISTSEREIWKNERDLKNSAKNLHNTLQQILHIFSHLFTDLHESPTVNISDESLPALQKHRELRYQKDKAWDFFDAKKRPNKTEIFQRKFESHWEKIQQE